MICELLTQANSFCEQWMLGRVDVPYAPLCADATHPFEGEWCV